MLNTLSILMTWMTLHYLTMRCDWHIRCALHPTELSLNLLLNNQITILRMIWLTRWPNDLNDMSAPMSSPIAISAMPSTATAVRQQQNIVQHSMITLMYKWQVAWNQQSYCINYLPNLRNDTSNYKCKHIFNFWKYNWGYLICDIMVHYKKERSWSIYHTNEFYVLHTKFQFNITKHCLPNHKPNCILHVKFNAAIVF